MDYRKLGRTDIKVSAICLGTMTWGQQNTEAEGHEQMDYAVDQGINFFDTAELYSIPPKAETQGSTERIVGSWFKASGKRSDIILATKIVGRTSRDYFRKDKIAARLIKPQIEEAINSSLERLQTDYIDLYQIHWPERKVPMFGSSLGYQYSPDDVDDAISIEETLAAMGDMVKAGKIRQFGLSNETAWGVAKYLRVHEQNPDLPRIVSIQNAYNLLNRSFEIGLSEFSHRDDVGLLAYSPLGQGYLTGKYRGGATPPGSRKTLFDRLQRYETPNADPAIEAYLDLAEKHGLNPAQMAIEFVTMQPFVTSNIIGATSMEQLKIALSSYGMEMSDEVMKGIEDIHLVHSNPCP